MYEPVSIASTEDWYWTILFGILPGTLVLVLVQLIVKMSNGRGLRFKSLSSSMLLLVALFSFY